MTTATTDMTTPHKLAFLFPGQGSQQVGMGQALAAAFPYVRELIEAADEAVGYKLSRICAEGPEEELQRTANTQPAILTVSVAAAEVLRREMGLVPALCAGHSLGEWSALVCAGALSFADAARLCHLRGRFMQEAVPEGLGAMAAIIGLARDDVAAACAEASGDDGACQPANDNGAGQVVISGHRTAVERALPLCKQRGAKLCKLLPVSAPFHCPLMAPAAERLREELQKVKLQAPRLPVIANVDAAPYPQGEAAEPLPLIDRLIRQVTGAVLWEGSMHALVALGMGAAVEVGPGRVLAGLLKRTAPAVALHNFSEPAQLEPLRALCPGRTG